MRKIAREKKSSEDELIKHIFMNVLLIYKESLHTKLNAKHVGKWGLKIPLHIFNVYYFFCLIHSILQIVRP